MASMQWIIGEQKGKLIMVLSVKRNIEDICSEEEQDYRQALKGLKEAVPASFKLFKHYMGYSASRPDRLYINGVHYFAFEARQGSKAHLEGQLERINKDFKEKIFFDDPVPLEKHFISEMIGLYRA
ncbi:hypothetical protein JXB28_02325 [Candidatus Woesearchaeota archaeon]|nr:hypothetical protein [Candidatus Woesearchaeota archaeon]